MVEGPFLGYKGVQELPSIGRASVCKAGTDAPIWRWTAASPKRLAVGERWRKPGGEREDGHQALDGGGRLGHPAGRRDRCGQSSHDSPLLVPTLETVSEALGALPEGTSVHLDRGYDSRLTRERLEDEPY